VLGGGRQSGRQRGEDELSLPWPEPPKPLAQAGKTVHNSARELNLSVDIGPAGFGQYILLDGFTNMRIVLATLIIITLVAVAFLLAPSPRKVAASSVILAPLGRTANADGSIKFLVGLTNSTFFALDCCVGRQRVTTLQIGSLSNPVTAHCTNYMFETKLTLPRKSGLLTTVTPPSERGPWVLGGYYRRSASKTEEQVRIVAGQANLLKATNIFPNWEMIPTVNVEK
jgi:hypothetical protein